MPAPFRPFSLKTQLVAGEPVDAEAEDADVEQRHRQPLKGGGDTAVFQLSLPLGHNEGGQGVARAAAQAEADGLGQGEHLPGTEHQCAQHGAVEGGQVKVGAHLGLPFDKAGKADAAGDPRQGKIDRHHA